MSVNWIFVAITIYLVCWIYGTYESVRDQRIGMKTFYEYLDRGDQHMVFPNSDYLKSSQLEYLEDNGINFKITHLGDHYYLEIL